MFKKDDWRMPLLKRYAKEFAYRFKDGTVMELTPASLGFTRKVLRMSPLEWPRLAAHQDVIPRNNASLAMRASVAEHSLEENFRAEVMATIAQWLLQQPEVKV